MAAQVPRNVYRGPSPRTDQTRLPTRAPGTRWKFECSEDKRFFLQKDASTSAGNAADIIWDEEHIVKGTCAWHSCHKWLDDNKTFIKDVKKNLEVLKDDFTAFKNCPTTELIPFWFVKMQQKWIAMGEELVFTKWASFYRTHRLTRIEMNEDNVLRGGYPNDNNIVEIQNAQDKLFRGHSRSKYIIFLDEFEFYLEDMSMRDMNFIGSMKPDVNSGVFYAEVNDILQLHQDNRPSMLSLSFPFASVQKGVPLGSTIVTSEHAIEGLHEIDSITIEQAMGCFRRGHAGRKMIDCFKLMINDPAAFCQDRKFDELGNWTKLIHLLRPLNPAMGADMVQMVTNVWRMLHSSGIPVIELDTLLQRHSNDQCLMSCDCATYQQRAWCKHSCAIAFYRGIMTSYPSLKDPRALVPARKRGRPLGRTHPLSIDT